MYLLKDINEVAYVTGGQKSIDKFMDTFFIKGDETFEDGDTTIHYDVKKGYSIKLNHIESGQTAPPEIVFTMVTIQQTSNRPYFLYFVEYGQDILPHVEFMSQEKGDEFAHDPRKAVIVDQIRRVHTPS